MSDNKKVISTSSLPAPAGQRMPARSSIHLPASGGAWFGTRTTLLKKDANFVRTHADYLDARATQAKSAQACVDARIELARSIARLDWLPEILETDYLCGKLDRAHEIEMSRLVHQTAEAHARAGLAAARKLLASYEPEPPSPAVPPSAPTGLTPADVQKVAQIMPEMKPETIQALVLALGGLMAEKDK